MLSILVEEDFDISSLAKMMRRYFSHLAQYSPKLRNLSESDIKCTYGLGKALYVAMKNAARRFEASSVKKDETANNKSAKQEKGETASEVFEPKPNIPKLLHGGKPIVSQDIDPNADPNAGLNDAADAAADAASDAAKTNKPKPKNGKFAKWKKAVEEAFEQVSEEDVEYMYFEMTGTSAKVVVSRGRNPYIQLLK